jgi:hypothetical protein
MPASMLPSPWPEFLGEIDNALTEPLELHCLGGFAVTHFYGSPRTTQDLDYFTAIPANIDLNETGEGSSLHKKYGVFLQKAAIASLPDNYDLRLTEMATGQFKHLKLMVLDPYDCILSKLERNADVDINDADYLFRTLKLDAQVLRDRYAKEMRPYLARQSWHDQTLTLWLDIFAIPT